MSKLTYDKFIKYFTIGIAIITGLIHVGNYIFLRLPSISFYAWHLMFGLVLVFLHYPTHKGKGNVYRIIDWLLIALSLSSGLYVIINFDFYTQIMQTGILTPTIMFFGVITLFLVLIAAVKVLGPILPGIAVVTIIYALIGGNLPGILGHRGYSFSRIVATTFSDLGVYGTPIAVSASNVFLFILFASFLGATGADMIFQDIAMAIAGKKRGGPAKMAIMASTFFGTISGSAVANVVSTGAFTIPLMKREGYEKRFAGAVEAVASTGGQIMPPIMGAAAFVLSDIAGIAYSTVCMAALLPALMYYITVFKMVDLESIKCGHKGMKEEDLPVIKEVAKRGLKLFIPVIVLLYLLLIKEETPMISAISATAAIIICGLLDKKDRLNLKGIARGFNNAGRSATQVIAACATSGVVVGMLALTGLGLKFSSFIVNLGGSSIVLSLLLSMLVCIVLGMGLPTTAAYIICATAIAPALISIGINPLAAHLFLLYFACISAITPPVAVASYAASGIAEEDALKVGSTAVKLGIAGFALPFTFTLNTAFITFEFNLKTLITWISAVIICYSVAFVVQGFNKQRLSVFERIGFAAVALLLIQKSYTSVIIGLILFVTVFYLVNLIKKGKVIIE